MPCVDKHEDGGERAEETSKLSLGSKKDNFTTSFIKMCASLFLQVVLIRHMKRFKKVWANLSIFSDKRLLRDRSWGNLTFNRH